jgi:hypothetical protein
LSDPIRDLARLLDSAEISYALIGGHAVNVSAVLERVRGELA